MHDNNGRNCQGLATWQYGMEPRTLCVRACQLFLLFSKASRRRTLIFCWQRRKVQGKHSNTNLKLIQEKASITMATVSVPTLNRNRCTCGYCFFHSQTRESSCLSVIGTFLPSVATRWRFIFIVSINKGQFPHRERSGVSGSSGRNTLSVSLLFSQNGWSRPPSNKNHCYRCYLYRTDIIARSHSVFSYRQ